MAVMGARYDSIHHVLNTQFLKVSSSKYLSKGSMIFADWIVYSNKEEGTFKQEIDTLSQKWKLIKRKERN